MVVCPRCTADLVEGFSSVCPSCGLIVRIPGIVKLALTLLGLGFAVAVVWALQADAVFAGLWRLIETVVVQPLGLYPPPFELTGTLKTLYDFTFGTEADAPWGGILLVLAGVVVGGIGGVLLRRAETRGPSSA